MNFLDFGVIVVFIAVFTLAFFAGIARTAAMILALGVGLVGACIGYEAVGTQFQRWFSPISKDMAQLVAFVALVAAIAVGCYYLVNRSFATGRLRTRVPLERRGGLPGSLVLVVLAAVLGGSVVIVLVQASERTVIDLQPSGPVVTLDHQFRASFLAGQVRLVTPTLYQGMSDVLRGPAPQILVPVGR